MDDVSELIDQYTTSKSLTDLDLGGLMGDLTGLMNRHQLSVPGEYTMLIRALVTIEGVLEEFCPELGLFSLVMKKLVRMEGAASNKFRNCSLGMKQRIGIAMALLGNPRLLVLDEPINGLDADGMRIMREVLTEIVSDGTRSVLISSHILGELEKIATHYGIIRKGRMIAEMTAEQPEKSCRTYIALETRDQAKARNLLGQRYGRVEQDEAGILRIYDTAKPEEVVAWLYQNSLPVHGIERAKIGLEEYYMDLMRVREGA